MQQQPPLPPQQATVQPVMAQYQQPSLQSPTSSQTSSFPAKTAKRIGIAQILLGSTAMVFGIVAAAMDCYVGEMGAGIWCGAFITLTGAFGCLSASKKRNGYIITSMIFSIICAAGFCTTLLVICAIALAEENDRYECWYDDDGDWICDEVTNTVCVVSDSIMIGVSVVSGILAIITSVLCCAGCCCNSQSVTPTVMYVHNQQGAAAPTMGLAYVVQGGQPSGAPVYVIPANSQNMYPYNYPPTFQQLPVMQGTPGGPPGYTMAQTQIPVDQSCPTTHGQPDGITHAQGVTGVPPDTKM